MIPSTATSYGFIIDGLGAHGSRTIMLAELHLLLAACPPDSRLDDYGSAIMDDNVLLKNTWATRKESFRRLRELYSLSSDLIIFRALRDLWEHEPQAQPLLALLCAAGRDPILRVTSGPVLTADAGDHVSAHQISKAISQAFPDRLNENTLASIGRHAASSWTQSGHLTGRSNKVRTRVTSYPTSVAYALLLGFLCGSRGEALFDTFWIHLLDTPKHLLHDQAFLASRYGWIDYRHSGTVTDISFAHLLRDDKKSS